ncbi:hypothetical protein PYW07_004786 [Mythimna separata]|uniref:Uncharacterized protein n=1 Tax=Mythimna separata TaxID=271217 RepID=A0AAD8DZA7_MYTSE|nr:hypothetical protein PYW07_004786 [Mythimna separata]
MAAFKTVFILLLVAFAMVMATVRVGPCDQVCSRIDAEKDECCRAHGHSGEIEIKRGNVEVTISQTWIVIPNSERFKKRRE